MVPEPHQTSQSLWSRGPGERSGSSFRRLSRNSHPTSCLLPGEHECFSLKSRIKQLVVLTGGGEESKTKQTWFHHKRTLPSLHIQSFWNHTLNKSSDIKGKPSRATLFFSNLNYNQLEEPQDEWHQSLMAPGGDRCHVALWHPGVFLGGSQCSPVLHLWRRQRPRCDPPQARPEVF